MSRRTHSWRVPLAVPGILPRLLVLLVAVIGVLAVSPSPLCRGIAIIAALVSIVVPRTLTAWLAAGGIVLGLVLTEPEPARTAIAVLAVHLIHVLGGLGLTVPVNSWIAPRVLLPTAVRFAAIQAVAQILALAAVLLPDPGTAGFPWLAPLGAAFLLCAIFVTLHAVRRADDVAGSASEPAPEAVAARSGSAPGADVGGPS